MSLYQFLYLQSLKIRKIRNNDSEIVSFLEDKGFIRYDIRDCIFVITEAGKAAASDYLVKKWVAWIALAISIVAFIRTI